MGIQVMRTQEYRANGAACLLTAQNADAPDKRAHWLMMAQAWVKLAEDAEAIARRSSPVQEPAD